MWSRDARRARCASGLWLAVEGKRGRTREGGVVTEELSFGRRLEDEDVARESRQHSWSLEHVANRPPTRVDVHGNAGGLELCCESLTSGHDEAVLSRRERERGRDGVRTRPCPHVLRRWACASVRHSTRVLHICTLPWPAFPSAASSFIDPSLLTSPSPLPPPPRLKLHPGPVRTWFDRSSCASPAGGLRRLSGLSFMRVL